ncbi:MAG: ABC transporter permease, partial [Tepidisphaeraceae bacterium]
MYKLHLILKYLRKRRIAWVSLVAVMLCTAMVLVVISVMGGWLRMFRESFHGLSGDVLVSGQSLSGFPHYEEMLEEIRKLPEVEAAVPTIQTFGLINVNNAIRKGVQVIGFPIADIGKVNKFPRSLHRQHLRYVEKADDPKRDLTDEERIDLRAQAERGAANPSFALHDEVPYEQILPKARNVRDWPGMIVGVGVVGIHKDEKGELYRPSGLYEAWAKLTVLGVSDESSSFDLGDKAERNYWIVDDSRTQVWQYDSNTVYVPFDALQKDLGMTASKATNRDGKEILIPARASNLQIKVRPGVNHVEVRDKVAAIVQGVFADHDLDAARFVDVETWEQSQYVWLKAIEKEVVLVTGLFGLISV